MFEQPHDAPRISKSPAQDAKAGPYWNLIKKVGRRDSWALAIVPTRRAHSSHCSWGCMLCASWLKSQIKLPNAHHMPLRLAPPPAQVAHMKWGTVYTLLVVGGVGIMAADMVGRAPGRWRPCAPPPMTQP